MIMAPVMKELTDFITSVPNNSKELVRLPISLYPVDTRHRFNVYKTSKRRRRRRIDVLWTLKRRRVSTGY